MSTTCLKLPPLSALRAFEAAARHLSFTLAAAELRLTASAISHQVRHLEACLGNRLFDRSRQGLRLTAAGAGYVSAVRDALRQISAATEEVQARKSGTLTISAVPALASAWLVPRIGGFRQRHPAIQLRILTDVRLVDLKREDVDIALRYGKGGWDQLASDCIMAETLLPVANPQLADRATPFHAADLARFPLLANTQHPEEWAPWLSRLAADAAPKMIFLESSQLTLQAANHGLGIALGRRPLVDADLAAGRLVALFPEEVPTGMSYYAVTTHEARRRREVKQFCDWLLAEVRSAASP